MRVRDVASVVTVNGRFSHEMGGTKTVLSARVYK